MDESRPYNDFEESLKPGDIIGGDYQIIGLVAVGGMGKVYKVRHLKLGRELALKTLKVNRGSQRDWQKDWNNFITEAKVLARLEHPHLVKVYDLGTIDNRLPYFVMDFVEGGTLTERIHKSALPIDLALSLFEEVADGLAYAEDLGLLHRDIKPSNILLTSSSDRNQHAKLVDFGLSATLHSLQEVGWQIAGVGPRVCGSPPYMSPEQTRGEVTDQRSDIYSFGCALFETLTGTPPFVGDTSLIVLSKHQLEEPPSLKEATLGNTFPEPLEKFVRRMLAKDPTMRYQSFHEVKALIRKLRSALAKADQSIEPNQDKTTITTLEEDKTRKIALKNSKAKATSLAAAALLALLGGGWLYQTTKLAPPSAPPPNNKPPQPGEHLKDPEEAAINAFKKESENDPGKLIDWYWPQHQAFSPLDAEGNYQIFNCPEGIDMGTFTTFEANSMSVSGKPIAADGRIILPKGQKLIYTPSQLALEHPKFFQAFKNKELFGLNLAKANRLNENSLTLLDFRQDIQYLDLSGANFEAKYLPKLQKLQDLRFLRIPNTFLSGADLAGAAGADILKRLKGLAIGRIAKMPQALAVLAKSSDLTYLEIIDEPLDKDSVKQIAAISKLETIRFDKSLNNSYLITELKPLKKLNQLDIVTSLIRPNIKEALPELSNLKIVVVQEGFIDKELLQELKKDFPELQIKLEPEKI
ncbi:MAG: serine/threonine protein kinase [Candidatus Obscuribacterales bacterium]|nr:serine/threonine protein kinase [Candidatus Obscuribacterales bacterium]